MTHVTEIRSLNRRTFFGAAAAALAIPAAASSISLNPDAHLLDLCAEFGRRETQVRRWNRDEIDEIEGEMHLEHWWEAFHEIVDTSAHTVAGIRAKAEVLGLALPCILGKSFNHEHNLALSLVTDIMELAP